MSTSQNPSPLQPYLCVRDAEAAIATYSAVFGMQEVYRLPMGDRIGHAELALGECRLLLASEFPESGHLAPASPETNPLLLVLYVEDLAEVLERAKAAGFTQVGETKDEFYGDRTARLFDPFGYRWSIHERLEALEPEEVVRRFEQMYGPPS